MSSNGAAEIRLGVLGVRRGAGYAGLANSAGMRLVAVCDHDAELARAVASPLGAIAVDRYEDLLDGVDAVVLANHFHQHAPVAIQALDAGKHVLSEIGSCFTLAEGAELAAAVEGSGKVYMVSVPMPYMTFVQEMRKLYCNGEIGRFVYGEGEYVHPLSAEEWTRVAPTRDHWQQWLPVTYYCMHSLSPLMWITDTRPVSVTGFIIPHDPDDREMARTLRVNDTASLIVVRMDNGALVKLLQSDLRGTGPWWVRVHGNAGLIENLRTPDIRWVRVKKETWDRDPSEPEERIYLPELPPEQRRDTGVGHAGADLSLLRDFATAIREGRKPYFDVYRGIAMSLVGILAYRSALDGQTLTIPDFANDAERLSHADDDWSPDPAAHRAGQPLPSVLGLLEPPDDATAYVEGLRQEMGLHWHA